MENEKSLGGLILELTYRTVGLLGLVSILTLGTIGAINLIFGG